MGVDVPTDAERNWETETEDVDNEPSEVKALNGGESESEDCALDKRAHQHGGTYSFVSFRVNVRPDAVKLTEYQSNDLQFKKEGRGKVGRETKSRD